MRPAKMPGVLIDTHCHLYFDSFDADRAATLNRMAEAGVAGALVAGIDAASNAQAQALCREHPQLQYAAGVHPTSAVPGDYLEGGAFDANRYLSPYLTGHTPACAVGECGIDLHWDTNPLEVQLPVFIAQLRLARERELPAVVHSRDADAPTLEALRAVSGVRSVLHCFNGSPQLLAYALETGCYVSFAGNLTYPKARELHAAAAVVPLDQLLVETDAPFLAPQPRRGKRCEPADVAHTARELARLRGMDPAALEEALWANSLRCFGRHWQAPG
jgi:TatD DNase family protein